MDLDTPLLELLSSSTASASPDAQFRRFIDALPNPTLVIDSDRVIVSANLQAHVQFGYVPDDLIGISLNRLIAAPTGRESDEDLAGLLMLSEARELGADLDLRGVRRDGSEFPVTIAVSPIAMDGGSYAIVSVTDITDRMRALRERSRLAAIVETSDDAIVSKTLDGEVTSWNGAAERLFGYDEHQMLGQSILLIAGAEQAEEEARLLACIGRGDHLPPFETVRRRSDGTEVALSVTLSPLRDGVGNVVGASSIMRDITESKRCDAELRRSNAELEQFAYVASHDLQEPLRMVANYVELLRERYAGQLDERADLYIGFASDGARRMQQLVSDLLAYSHVGSEGRPLTPIPAADALAAVRLTLHRAIQESGAQVRIGPLPTVRADESQLGQLFQNLISNALKFRSAAPPVIDIHADRQGAYWRFAVRDNGIGMEMPYAQRIFHMFQRLHQRNRYEGSGIGLAIAKRIVERHGGEIWADSRPGEGTTFFFTLHAAGEAA